MKLFTTLALGALCATGLQAAPFCPEMLDAQSLPKKYARSAPIYSETESGWIFTKDQLKDRYAMKPSSAALVAAIVQEFAARDVALAIVIAPPRPVIAGQALLDGAMGETGYDVAAARASFNALIAQLSKTGAIVPNLQHVALRDPETRAAFYFRRDTHWTTVGAAASAARLGEMVADALPGGFPGAGGFTLDTLHRTETITEKGSLAKIVRDVCKSEPGQETAPSFDLSRGTAPGLLDSENAGPKVALLGSSFSDRYKRDHYRFGDALSRALDADVENFSVSGGGAIGAIEAYVLSGALERRAHELVVWELPYTDSFNSASFLRQLLGALRLQGRTGETHSLPDPEQKTITLSLDHGGAFQGIEIVTDARAAQTVKAVVTFEDGKETRLSLRRRAAVPADMRSASLFAYTGDLGHRDPVSVTVHPGKGAVLSQITLFPGS